jgi:RNA polymerase sigma factor FliA
VLAYSPMVRYIAMKKIRELPMRCELDDLVSCGLIALLECVERFDPKRGATFEQFAWIRVAGAVVDELRRQDWASRSTRSMARRIDAARDSLTVREGLAPTEDRIAEVLQISVDEVRSTLVDAERAEVLSLNAPTRNSDESMPVEVGDTIEAQRGEHEPERAAMTAERLSTMRDAIAELTERERDVISLVHVQELQGVEVGRILGVSESRVSQILSGAREKLRAHMDEYAAA